MPASNTVASSYYVLYHFCMSTAEPISYCTSDILIDSLFASLSDLETSLVEVLLSRRDISERIETLQTAVLVFKSAALKTLSERIGEFLTHAHSTTDESRLKELRERELSNVELRRQEIDKRRCIHQLRSLLRGKLMQSSRILNESYHSLSADVATME